MEGVLRGTPANYWRGCIFPIAPSTTTHPTSSRSPPPLFHPPSLLLLLDSLLHT